MTEFPAIDWSGAAPETSVRISARARYVRLRVLPPGRVELVLPRRHDVRALPGFVQQHRQWLIDTLARMQTEHAQQQAQRVAPDEIFLSALNERWQVEYRRGTRNGCWERAGRGLLVQYKNEEWDKVLQRWLAERARQTVGPRLLALAAELGFTCNGYAIRGQKTRWGSCSPKNVINLNWRLLFLPPEQVRYLMVHELCHTVHLNHSTRFWDLVEKMQPDYKALDAAMRKANRMVPAWAL
ncbi:M48 family metallopeptidase [Sulfurivermis fontis]|uniref:M48 family metallopeptidase n=1 Tax=Sulfurivermis fontis TaxID=1972068 RepID=UPI0015595AEF|nr:SprT family zinc-dependent metalloprotease [Sulfurivermis fontis]